MKPIIDISSHQRPDLIDYQALSAGNQGAILRACYGNRKDVHFERHYQELKAQGKSLGAYIYVTNYMSAASQVQTLLNAIQGKDLPLGIWVDVELETGAENLTKQKVHEVIQLLEAALGYQVGIYTSANYWRLIMNGPYYTNRRLWVANYGVTNPTLPIGWNRHWIWQYTDKGSLPGYPGNIDLNLFNGTEEEFEAWTRGQALPEQPPLTRLHHPTTKDARISQYFGENPSWYPTSQGHNGLDFAVLEGTQVYAAAQGVVERVEKLTTGYGRHIRIRHSHGITIYGHLSQTLVTQGESVQEGQLIGLSGGNPTDPYAGFSTGMHLHFEYRWDQPAPQVPGGFVYNAVDPLPLINPERHETMIYKIQVICSSLNIRSGPGIGYNPVGGLARGDTREVYQEQNGWMRIGAGQWISGNPAYVTKIETPGPSLQDQLNELATRVTAIEAAMQNS